MDPGRYTLHQHTPKGPSPGNLGSSRLRCSPHRHPRRFCEAFHTVLHSFQSRIPTLIRNVSEISCIRNSNLVIPTLAAPEAAICVVFMPGAEQASITVAPAGRSMAATGRQLALSCRISEPSCSQVSFQISSSPILMLNVG